MSPDPDQVMDAVMEWLDAGVLYDRADLRMSVPSRRMSKARTQAVLDLLATAHRNDTLRGRMLRGLPTLLDRLAAGRADAAQLAAGPATS